MSEHVRPEAGQVIVDIGCGTGDLIDFLPDVEYVGFDPSAEYVAAARARAPARARVFVAGVEDVAPSDIGRVDVVVAFGVVHHLDDRRAHRLFALARDLLPEGGRLVTLDPFLETGQSRIERFMVRNDRGRHVRTPAAYVALARRVFPTVETRLHPGMLRLPFAHTHRVVECTRGLPDTHVGPDAASGARTSGDDTSPAT